MSVEEEVKHLSPKQKKILQVGGVGAGAVVAYLYWRNRSAAAAQATPVDTGTAATDGYGTDIPSGSGGVYDPGSAASSTTVGNVIASNADWYAAALNALESAGWDSQAAATALGAFLDHQPLTAQQQAMIRVALGAAGQPPTGGPYAIVSAPTGSTPGKPGTPSGLRTASLTATSFVLSWSGVSGATGYRVYGAPGGTVSVAQPSASFQGLKAHTRYGPIAVAAVGAGGEGARSGSITVTTKSASPSLPVVAHPQPVTPTKSAHPSGPAYDVVRVTRPGQSLASLVADYNHRHGTHLTWEQVWSYNLAHRDPRTVAKLKSRRHGDNVTVYIGSTFWIPR